MCQLSTNYTQEVIAVKKWCVAGLMLFSMFLTSCGREKRELSGLVVKAEVRYDHQGQILRRTYTDPEELSKVLMGLQLPGFAGFPQEDPDTVLGDSCKVKLTYYNGTCGVILQQANLYRSVDYHAWEKIDPHQAEKLYPILQSLPGDVSQT